jgi:hypothetical protein
VRQIEIPIVISFRSEVVIGLDIDRENYPVVCASSDQAQPTFCWSGLPSDGRVGYLAVAPVLLFNRRAFALETEQVQRRCRLLSAQRMQK